MCRAESRDGGPRLIVLGLDTATWTAAVGISHGTTILAEAAAPAERSHTAMLPALIEQVVAASGVSLRDLAAVAVSIGPGSFTGLRVALGLGQGIAFAAGIPLVAVPTLEALALAADAPLGATVWAALDARKQEVYAAAFRIDGPQVATRVSPDEALRPAALAARLTAAVILVGDAAAAYPDELPGPALLRPFTAYPPRGGVVAVCGARRLAAGGGQNPGLVEPVYVRAPEAVLNAQKLRRRRVDTL